ncbi:YPDG domain-containing protein, partial [Staphylococcus simulans]|uniref:Rib/alpha-like domain-containing protein n=1 Tax=Staphylococcus simulans TaxID=1286 RepID=UPI001E58C35B
VDETKVPDGQTSGEFEVPVTVTYPDKTTDTVNVKVTVGPKDSITYEPTVENITKPYGTPTTADEITSKVTVPDFPKDGEQPKVTVDNPALIPDGKVPGTYEVPVTVTYPDGTKDHTTVTVVVAPKDSDTYEPTVENITKPYGTPTTADEVKAKVTVPNFPVDKGTPVVAVDDPSQLPDGNTEGTTPVNVTVTYPDGTKDHVTVNVTVGKQPDNTKYEPTSEKVEKPFGTPTTAEDVVSKVAVPGFPKEGQQPTVTVDDPTKLPKGDQPGTYDVPVTVTYPDGTTDKVTVKVTVGEQPQNDKYDPRAGEIIKHFGTPTTVDEVKDKVTVPGYPKDGQPYVVTVDESKIPNGQVSGEFEVPATVTYPDKTTDTITVKVTVGPKDSDTYQPTVDNIEKPYGTPTTADEITSKVTVPDFPKDGEQPKVTVDNPALIPDGKVPGTYEVPVTVTYPDGTKDHTTVTVVVAPKDSDTYEPVVQPIEKPYGQPTTAEDVISKVSVPGYPTTGEQPKVTVDNPALIPDGKVPGTYEVPVTVTYPDGTKDHTTVTITVLPQPDADVFTPNYNDSQVNPGQAVVIPQTGDRVPAGSTFEVVNNSGKDHGWTATVDKTTGLVTVTAPKDALEGDKTTVKVVVTYPDGTKDTVEVTVTAHDTIAPEAPVVNPIEAGAKVITGTGKEPGTKVTVTFPDGSTVTTQVGPDGKWTVDVPANVVLKDGDTVNAVSIDKAGNTSKITTATVKDTVAPDAPVVNPIEAGAKVITGTAEPGTKVTVTFPDGSTVTTQVGPDGKWTVDVPANVVLKDGDTVNAVSIDKAGNTSKITTATVKDTVAPEAPCVNNVHT